jgi:hypothetical protein
MSQCERCEGSGEHECPQCYTLHECDECKGTGEVS